MGVASQKLADIIRRRIFGIEPIRAAGRPSLTIPTGAIVILSAYLKPFEALKPLRDCVLAVLAALPDEVRRDLFEDSRFRMTLDDCVPGKGRTVWLACPGTDGNGSRCVVLKPKLADCDEDFAKYVVAHELAHAYLRNGGLGDIDDPEEAADAVAETWGFSKHPKS